MCPLGNTAEITKNSVMPVNRNTSSLLSFLPEKPDHACPDHGEPHQIRDDEILTKRYVLIHIHMDHRKASRDPGLQ